MGGAAPVGALPDLQFRRAEVRDAEALAQLMSDPAVYGGLLQLPYPGVEAWRKRMGKHYPAMALVEVKALVEDDAKVEIEATAVL